MKKLIVPLRVGKPNIKYYVINDEIFDVINTAHIKCGHGGRNRLEKALFVKYANVTGEIIMFYLQLCRRIKLNLLLS